MNKEVISEILVEKLSHDGRGIAHINGKTTFIFGSLAQEKVELLYHKKHRKYDEAFIAKITHPSDDRVTPSCLFFGVCGGCSLQHMSQAKQIEFKQDVLLEQLKHFGDVIPDQVMDPLYSYAFGYRRKARFSVRYVIKKSKLLVGFREMFHPQYLADIDSCKILHPQLSSLITPLKEILSKLISYQNIPQIEVALGDNATALIIRHLEALNTADQQALLTFAQTYNLWLFLQPAGYDSIHKIYPDDNHHLLIYSSMENINLNFHPIDFIQAHDDINKKMIMKAIELLQPNASDNIIDFFCGIGNFTLPIAKYGAKVLGIDVDNNMILRAKFNAEKNHLSAQFLAQDLFIKENIANISLANINKILIDPPRSGAKLLIENLPKNNISHILYVSCNPATLARDAGILKTNGYALSKVLVMDMFSQTKHIEAMALFERP